jgi:hypothetical protein
MADFEERIYALGVDALAEQERQVSEVRGRASAILAAGAVVPSLLAHAVFRHNHPHGALEILAAYLGVAGAIGVLVCTVNLLRPRELGFSIKAARRTGNCSRATSSSSRGSTSRWPMLSTSAGPRTPRSSTRSPGGSQDRSRR